jgi:hypothetical protein
MLAGLPPGSDRRAVSNDDVNVLLDLGYEVSGTFPMNQGATPAGGSGVIGFRDGLSPSGQTCATRITMELCPSPADFVTITLADLIANDINATGIAGFELIQGSGALFVSGTDEWEYHPNNGGIHVLRYVPVNNPTAIDINTVGNSTCVTVEAMPCDPRWHLSRARRHATMICNPGFDHPSNNCSPGDLRTGAGYCQFTAYPVPSWHDCHMASPDWQQCTSHPNPHFGSRVTCSNGRNV